MSMTHTPSGDGGRGEDASLKEIAYARACALVAEGYDLAAIAARDRTPSVSTLRRWLTERDDVHSHYERARLAREDKWIADAVALVDPPAGATRAGVRLRVDARKRRLAMLRKDALKTPTKGADNPVESGSPEPHRHHAEDPEGASRDEIMSAHLQAVLHGRFEEYVEQLNAER